MLTLSVRKYRRKSTRKSNNKNDAYFIALVVGLTVLGLIVVADASAPQALSFFDDKYYFVKQQVVWAAIGIVVFVLTSNINYRIWEKYAHLFLVLSIITLVFVLLPGIGNKFLGARRWLSVGPFSFQPSELVKLSLALYFAKLIENKRELVAFIVPLVAIAILIMLQPDLGTLIVVSSIALSQIFVSGLSLIYFAGITAVGLISSVLLILTSDYRRDRLMTFIETTADPLGKGYHIRQILYALGMGGMFGVGLGKSRQKYLFLPESASDSIFAVIAEEAGYLGSIIIVSLFLFYIYKAMKISLNAPDDFGKALALGLTVWIGGQAFLNLASMTALTPLTGIPLPFFSYGGSALVMILFASGILVNIGKHGKT